MRRSSLGWSKYTQQPWPGPGRQSTFGCQFTSFSHVEEGFKPKGYWKEQENSLAFLKQLEETLQLRSPSDWARVNVQQILRLGGRGFLKEYQSLHNALQELQPNSAWDFFSVGRYPSNHWKQIENQREFMDRMKDKYQIKQQSDWKQITWADVERHGGRTLRKMYCSFPGLLRVLYPEEKIDDFEVREKLPQGFWDNPQHRHRFLERVKQHFQIQSLADWNQISTRDLVMQGGSGLLAKYGGSLEELLKSEFPEEDWQSLDLRPRVRAGYWTEERMRAHVEMVGTKLGIQELEDWSRVSVKQFKEASGDRAYQNDFPTFFDLLQAVYPQHDWNALRRGRAPHSYWKDKRNQRNFLEQFAEDRGLHTMADWKQVTYAQIEEGGGRSLLRLYPSILHMLQAHFPEYPWSVNDRKILSGSYWKDPTHRNELVEEIERKFLITEPKDWYRVSWKQLQTLRAASYIKRNGGLYQFLQDIYPSVDWQPELFQARDKRSSQRELFAVVSRLYPGEEVVEEFLHDQLTRESGSPIEFDVYLPGRQIAFEYQGEHHFSDIPAMGQLELCRARDNEKLSLCKQHGIDLHQIPYWWDGTQEHLLTFTSDEPLHEKE